jgi:hypothetical protein
MVDYCIFTMLLTELGALRGGGGGGELELEWRRENENG